MHTQCGRKACKTAGEVTGSLCSFSPFVLPQSPQAWFASGGGSRREALKGAQCHIRPHIFERRSSTCGRTSKRSCSTSRRSTHASRSSGTTDRKSTRLNSSHLGISYAVF